MLAKSAETLNDAGRIFLRGMTHDSSEAPSSATFPQSVCQMAQNQGEYTESNVRNMPLCD
jgi:hypothetical protein